jgi:hypothetical protein
MNNPKLIYFKDFLTTLLYENSILLWDLVIAWPTVFGVFGVV